MHVESIPVAQARRKERVLEAKALLDAGLWSGAYYLAGYAVECGLKACVLAYVEETGAIFQEKKFSERCFTHDVEELLKLASLESVLGPDLSRDPILSVNWTTVKAWSEAARYRTWAEPEARGLFEAVANPNTGVLPWIRARW